VRERPNTLNVPLCPDAVASATAADLDFCVQDINAYRARVGIASRYSESRIGVTVTQPKGRERLSASDSRGSVSAKLSL